MHLRRHWAVLSACALLGCRSIIGIENREEPSSMAGPGSNASSGTGAGGSCGDLQSDALNCGACQHSCLGGTCAHAQCQPFLVAETPNSDQQQGLVADPGASGNIYWGEFRSTAALFSVPKSGGAATTLSSVPDYGWLDDLATDGMKLYFSNYSDGDFDSSRGIYSIGFDGSGLIQMTGGNVLGTASVATNQGFVYYSNQYDPLAIARVPVGGGNVEPILHFPGSNGTVVSYLKGGILVDDDYVYYSYEDDSLPATTGVYRIRHDGSGNLKLFFVDGGALVQGLHLGELYWKAPDGFVYHGHADGTGPTTKLAQMDSQLVFHDGYIYAQRATNVIRVQEGLQSPTEELVWFGDSPWPLTTDGVSLIWVEHYKGDVYRLAF
jgi:Domain of unknown function (DUF5050)